MCSKTNKNFTLKTACMYIINKAKSDNQTKHIRGILLNSDLKYLL